MARFAGVPVDPPAAPRPRFGGVPVDAPAPTGNRIYDMEAVISRPSIQQQELRFTDTMLAPDLLPFVRFARPELKDVDDRTLAAAIRREGYPDMDPVEFYRRTGLDQSLGYDTRPQAPTAGMSTGQKFNAGVGQSYVSAGRGVKQLIADSAVNNLGVADRVLRGVGLDGVADTVGRTVGAPVVAARQGVQRTVDDARALDAPLLDTGAGQGGAITGNLSQLLLPGMALRGTTAGRLLLPTTVRGNAALGAATGAVQPVATGESRAGNIGVGAVAGAAIPTAVKGGRKVAGGVMDALRPEQAATREAVQLIQREAASPAALTVAAPSRVTGVTRTLAEETLDPGVARLETRARTRPGNNFAARDSSNNAARIQALEGFAGDEAALEAAKRARSATASPLLARAKAGTSPAAQALAQVDAGAPFLVPGMGRLEKTATGYRMTPTQGAAQDLDANEAQQFLAWARGLSAEATPPTIDTAPVLQRLAAMRQEYTGNSQMQAALDKATAEITAAGGNLGYLENARQTIGNLAAGTADGSMVKLPDLLRAKDALTDTLEQAAPDFAAYLDAWRQGSVPINRMEVGQELLRRGTGGLPDPVTGELALAPATFGRQAKNLDALAASATGFPRATAASTLRPQDLATVDAVVDDLSRTASRLRLGSGGGSHTQAQRELGERVGAIAAKAVEATPLVGQYLAAGRAYLKEQGAQRLDRALERVLAEPEEYRAMAALLSRKDRQLLTTALTRAGALGGASVARVEEAPLPE